MRNPSFFKQEFLKKWIKGLQVCCSSSKKMTILERKKAIKLSANVAMASARNGTTCWSRAIIDNATQNNEDNRIIVERILGPQKALRSVSSVMHKKILKKSHRRVCRRRVLLRKRDVAETHSIAKRLVKKKTQLLKSLVPGGELMETQMALIAETLDYIAFLRAQVDVMRDLATTTK